LLDTPETIYKITGVAKEEIRTLQKQSKKG
jgi:hypothetical protein